MKKIKNLPPSAAQKLEAAGLKNQKVTREGVRDHLVQDIKGIYVLLAEVLNSRECVDALTDVFYGRYVAMMKEREAAPPIPGLDPLPDATAEEIADALGMIDPKAVYHGLNGDANTRKEADQDGL